jgi:hypothetical protein
VITLIPKRTFWEDFDDQFFLCTFNLSCLNITKLPQCTPTRQGLFNNTKNATTRDVKVEVGDKTKHTKETNKQTNQQTNQQLSIMN